MKHLCVLVIYRDGDLNVTVHQSSKTYRIAEASAMAAAVGYLYDEAFDEDDATGDIEKDFALVQAYAREQEDAIVEVYDPIVVDADPTRGRR